MTLFGGPGVEDKPAEGPATRLFECMANKSVWARRQVMRAIIAHKITASWLAVRCS
jgi:hypothetical protein